LCAGAANMMLSPCSCCTIADTVVAITISSVTAGSLKYPIAVNNNTIVIGAYHQAFQVVAVVSPLASLQTSPSPYSATRCKSF